MNRQEKDKRRGASMVSPYFRQYDASSGAQLSPLLGSRASNRYQAAAAASRSGGSGHRKTSFLPQLFSSTIEDSQRMTQSSRQRSETQPLLSQPNRNNRGRISIHAAPNLPPQHQESMHVIPKNSILTRLEHLSSLYILYVLLLPLLLASLTHFSLQPWKYAEWNISCVSPCSSPTDIFQLTGIPAWSSFLSAEFITMNSSRHVQSPLAITVNLSSEVFADSFEERPPATRWISLLGDERGALHLALPLMDLSLFEFSHPGSSLSVAYAVEYGDADDERILSLQLLALSWDYIVCTSAIKGFLLIVLLVGARKLHASINEHAHYLRTRVEWELYPFPSSTFSSSHFMLPEQYACLAALVSLSLWLNPLSLLTDLAALTWIPRWVRFVGHVLSTCGAYGTFSSLLWYLKCLRWSSNATDEKVTLASLEDMENSLRSSSSPSSMLAMLSRRDSSRLASLLHSLFCTYVTPLHPKASEFVDHIFPIGVLFFLSCLIACSRLWILLWWKDTTAVHSVDEWVWANASTLLYLFDGLLLVVAGLWALSLLQNYWRTQKALRNTRYMQSRMRQVSFRILDYQMMSGVLLLLILAAASLASYSSLPSVPAWPALQPLLTRLYVQVRYLGLFFAVTGRPTAQALPIEAAVFMSILLASTAWCLMPAASLKHGVEVESFVPLRRQLSPHDSGRVDLAMPEAASASAPSAMSTSTSTITALQSFSRGKPFCLELACNMLEASYQTYFHEDDLVRAVEQPTGPKVDLKRLGLEPFGVMSCTRHCTFGFIGHSEQELVVAFRGSTMANILSDMKVAQVPLPSLSKPKDFFLRALYGCTTYFAPPTHPTTYGSILPDTPPLRDKSGDLPPSGSLRERAWSVAARCIELLPLCNQTLPRVHLGFWESYASLRDEFLVLIARALRNASQPGSFSTPTVWLTGHSLGAAMAVLASLDLAANLPVIAEAIQSRQMMDTVPCDLRSVSICVTCFGCPRVGNTAFMTTYNAQIRDCFRVEIDGDLVTMVPKILGFYRHVGKAVLLDELATGNIVVQPSVLEQSLFRRSLGTLGNHSLEKYRLCLEACFEPEELAEYLATEQVLIAMASTPSSASSVSLPAKTDGVEPSPGNPFVD